MKNSRGSSLVASVVAVVGLVGLGVGGFNLVRTGCPLGGCSAGTEPAITNVDYAKPADLSKKSGCPLSAGSCASTEVTSGCSATEAAVVTPVAAVEATKSACPMAADCSAECRAACEAGGSSCESKDACTDAKLTNVSNADKSACSEAKSSCDQAKSECTAEQTAAADAPASPKQPG